MAFIIQFIMHRFEFTVFGHHVRADLTTLGVVCAIAAATMTAASFVLYLLPLLE